MSNDELLNALTEVLDSLETQQEPRESSKPQTKMQKLEEIYSIETSASPTDLNWSERVIGELNAFKSVKETEHGDLIPHFRYLKPYKDKNQFLIVQYRRKKGSWEWAIIRLPLFYPKLPPNSITSKSRELEVYTKHTDPSRCLGKIVSDRWPKTGELGVGHWLCFCEVFIRLRDNGIKV